MPDPGSCALSTDDSLASPVRTEASELASATNAGPPAANISPVRPVRSRSASLLLTTSASTSRSHGWSTCVSTRRRLMDASTAKGWCWLLSPMPASNSSASVSAMAARSSRPAREACHEANDCGGGCITAIGALVLSRWLLRLCGARLFRFLGHSLLSLHSSQKAPTLCGCPEKELGISSSE